MIIQSCFVNGTRLIWSSKEYIGTGGNNFEFALHDTRGFTIPSHEFNTTAVLLDVDAINYTLESNVTFTVSTDGIILCRDDSGNVRLNITVIVSK